jgi:hypothetical protein
MIATSSASLAFAEASARYLVREFGGFNQTRPKCDVVAIALNLDPETPTAREEALAATSLPPALSCGSGRLLCRSENQSVMYCFHTLARLQPCPAASMRLESAHTFWFSASYNRVRVQKALAGSRPEGAGRDAAREALLPRSGPVGKARGSERAQFAKQSLDHSRSRDCRKTPQDKVVTIMMRRQHTHDSPSDQYCSVT